MRFNRRCFLRTATTACIAGQSLPAAGRQPISEAPYKRASTDWLANCRFGIGVHWTAQTVPRSGSPKSFQKAVANFDLDGFMATVEHAGADYVLFTAAHALQMLPAPHPALDRILPGRTCERDLIQELADALQARHADPGSALFRRAGGHVRPRVQQAHGTDDVQRRHLPGWHNGSQVG